MAHEAGYKRQETTTVPVVTISERSHAASQADGAGGDGDNKDNKDHLAGDSTFQPLEAQHAVPQDDNERGGEAHAATERRASEDEDEEEDEEAELRMPESFDFEDHNTGAAHAGTVDPFDAVRTLGNLWRRMQVR